MHTNCRCWICATREPAEPPREILMLVLDESHVQMMDITQGLRSKEIDIEVEPYGVPLEGLLAANNHAIYLKIKGKRWCMAGDPKPYNFRHLMRISDRDHKAMVTVLGVEGDAWKHPAFTEWITQKIAAFFSEATHRIGSLSNDK